MELKKALEEINATYNNAFNRGDAEGCASIFEEDVVMMPPNHPTIRGKKAITEFFQTFIGGFHRNHTSAVVDCGSEGDLAYLVATYAVTAADDSPVQGKFVNVLRRRPDGTWKISVAIFNTDKP